MLEAISPTMSVSSQARRREYTLECTLCGERVQDDGYILQCGVPHAPSLLRSVYDQSKFKPRINVGGLFRYRDWLPSSRSLESDYGPAVFHDRKLGASLGLSNLWIAFSGYWPARDARMPTATFKDLEALAVIARMPERDDRVLVVASAGNTAAAFARACAEHERRCLIVVPERGVRLMRGVSTLPEYVKIVVIANASYDDAIALSKRIATYPGFSAEGGIQNVARRDAVGTILLAAVESSGRMPDVYVQAIGSGAGPIAIHEAALRLRSSRLYGHRLPRLLVSQNAPFAPVVEAWAARRCELSLIGDDDYRERTQRVCADALTNRRPAYATRGGLFDALRESCGDVVAVTNDEARAAAALFRETHDVDLSMEAGVGLASLRSAIRAGQVRPEDSVVLHVTGGGREALIDARRAIAEPLPSLRLDVEAAAGRAGTEAAIRLFD